MALKTNPYYINYQSGIGLAISDALLAKMIGTDEQSRLAVEFLDWFDKEIKKPPKMKGKHKK